MNPFGEIHEPTDWLDYDPSDDIEDGICKECGEECKIIEIDLGIGPYEYGSIREIHTNLVKVSNCCEADFEKL